MRNANHVPVHTSTYDLWLSVYLNVSALALRGRLTSDSIL
jgi:hypothetical protein